MIFFVQDGLEVGGVLVVQRAIMECALIILVFKELCFMAGIYYNKLLHD